MFHFKDRLPYDLVCNITYKLQCGRCNFSITVRLLKARLTENTNVSPVNFKKVKPSAENSIRSHLSFSDLFPSFNNLKFAF